MFLFSSLILPHPDFPFFPFFLFSLSPSSSLLFP